MANIPGNSKFKGSVRGTEGSNSGGGGLTPPPGGGAVINQTPPKGGGGAPYVHKGKYAASERGTEC